jgi:iron complex transport system substrate-binding protein
MRAFAWPAALSLIAASSAVEAAPPRVASLNLCTDELLLLLADPDQIATVTHLSQQPHESRLWRAAQRYRTNDGSLLSVVPAKPRLVLTMGGGARDRQVIARRLGIRVLELPYPQRLSDVQDGITAVGAALGRPARAEMLNRRIDQLRRSVPAGSRDTLWLGGGGRTVQANSLAAEWMRLAGFAQRPVTGDRVSLEHLLVRPPAVLLRSDYRQGQYSSEQRWLSHPLARRVRAGRTLATDGRAWTCMGPTLIAEIERLRGTLGK